MKRYNRDPEMFRRRGERIRAYGAGELSISPIDCDECQRLLPVFVLRETTGADPGTAYPAVELHLLAGAGCPECLTMYARLLDDHQVLQDLAAELREPQLVG